jgi:hypothetical protein
MAENFEVMPDYLGALELELRAHALPVVTERGHRLRWRRPVFVTAVAVLALVPMLLIADTIRDQTPAYGRPAILAAPPVPVPASIRNGFALKKKAGPGTSLDRARPFRAFGDIAYLLDGDGVWCVSVPDPTAREPEVERGIACTRTRDFFRVGIQVVVRRSYVAVIPQGVKDPMLIHANGTRQSLQPNAQGVVTVAPIAPGDSFVLYGIDGQRKTSHAR